MDRGRTALPAQSVREECAPDDEADEEADAREGFVCREILHGVSDNLEATNPMEARSVKDKGPDWENP